MCLPFVAAHNGKGALAIVQAGARGADIALSVPRFCVIIEARTNLGLPLGTAGVE